jgi:riboflavin synthase
MRLTVEVHPFFEALELGESIALNGTCLTVVESSSPFYTVDVSPETVERTTIGRLSFGERVNLERALRLSDRLGGHLVTGHVDGVATLSRSWQEGEFWRLRFQAPSAQLKHIVKKGSVAVDGISLTVADLGEAVFEVSVIPLTWQQTTLQFLRPGSPVNLETDVLAKYVERLMSPTDAGSKDEQLMERLRSNGFL